MNAKKIQKDMERWAKAKNRQQAKANPPKVEPEQPQPEAPVVVSVSWLQMILQFMYFNCF